MGSFSHRLRARSSCETLEQAHPRLQILGLLEARLIEADVLLLGGLDETVWPPQARTDAFLNRPMRAALGLTPPERKLGQTAHDFVQAMGKRRGDFEPRPQTRWRPYRGVAVSSAYGGAWRLDVGDMPQTRRGLSAPCAEAIDRPDFDPPPSGRPLPRPPLTLRPKRLSVTQIETLRRDPYAIYAEKILRLKQLDPLGGASGVAEVGSAVHAALERFVKGYPWGPLPSGAREILAAILREALAPAIARPGFRSDSNGRGSNDQSISISSSKQGAATGSRR